MREIPLTRGLVALIDDADHAWLSQWKWSAIGSPGSYYAARRASGSREMIYMHKVILGISGRERGDHCNRNPLDNQRGNLRCCNKSQDSMNRRVSKTPKGCRGTYIKSKGKWRALICVEGRSRYLGTFDTREKAALAYDAAARRFHGEFAVLNFPARKRPVDRLDAVSYMEDMMTWEAFEEMAVKAGHKHDTIRKWRERKRVPYRLRGEFIDAAKKRGFKVRFEDFDKLARAA
jgi:hypothetical protein